VTVEQARNPRAAAILAPVFIVTGGIAVVSLSWRGGGPADLAWWLLALGVAASLCCAASLSLLIYVRHWMATENATAHWLRVAVAGAFVLMLVSWQQFALTHARGAFSSAMKTAGSPTSEAHLDEFAFWQTIGLRVPAFVWLVAWSTFLAGALRAWEKRDWVFLSIWLGFIAIASFQILPK